MPAQHNTQQHKAEHRRREQPHPRGRGRNSRWQAFCLHMRRINPHSGSHLYSFIGLWCPLNQSVKGWPDGASLHTHHSEGGERRGGYTPHHIASADTAVQRHKQSGLGRKRRKCEGALLNNEAGGAGGGRGETTGGEKRAALYQE